MLCRGCWNTFKDQYDPVHYPRNKRRRFEVIDPSQIPTS